MSTVTMWNDAMLDNVEIAGLTRINELAERYGLKPYDFVASFAYRDSHKEFAIVFEVPVHGNAELEKRYDQMLTALGIGPESDEAALRGSPKHIIDALDSALQRAPRPHG